MGAMLTATKVTPMALPVMYVEPGRPLCYVYAHAGGWEQLHDAVGALEPQGAYPRMVYAYQEPGDHRLLATLVLDVGTMGANGATISKTLATIPGIQTISVQEPEYSLAVAEQQSPNLVGVPAVIFGRSIVGDLTRGVVEAQGAAGEALLHRLGHDAGHLAASALPPLMQKLGLSMNLDLLTKRILDFQTMGWATVRDARVDDQLRGEVVLEDTFESADWNGTASTPKCHFLAGFVEGVFSTALGQPFHCFETECQATGAAVCRFYFRPGQR